MNSSAITDQAIEGLYATGHWLHAQGRYRDAATVFRAMAGAKPKDERAWLALGACHEASGQTAIALELYVVGRLTTNSVRCAVARVRLLRNVGRETEADDALASAAEIANDQDDEALKTLIAAEKRGLS